MMAIEEPLKADLLNSEVPSRCVTSQVMLASSKIKAMNGHQDEIFKGNLPDESPDRMQVRQPGSLSSPKKGNDRDYQYPV